MFRRILGTPSNAASQVRAVLPPGLVARLDLDKLALVPGSLVDATLRWRHTDLLFTVPLDGREAFVYVLIEHQSGNDPVMAFRMLRYVVRIWDRYLADHPRASRLPVVIPLVVHHNDRAWTAPVEVADLVDLDVGLIEAWREYLPRFRFLLDDLVGVDARALRERPLTSSVRLTLLLLKIAPGNPWLVKELGLWADELRAVLDGPDGREEFAALLRYIELVGEAEIRDQLHDLITALGSDAEEAYMTIAEQLRAEGRVEGRAEGRVETLVQQLTLKFGPLPEALLTTVRNASADQLRTWTVRVLSADTLDQLFG
ncbi:Rpn family recombination-promoting nuclease/putative transposase [Frankia sp. Cj3]|uniref:Rpn family recombination-promoting nuclease/putative transposase n=2 Tax=unclassified Frankia TaxID=2632575 RepID=UPI001EF5A3B4|nr:Rpn family recombination-promoting nuclease/putative transposase [Frankia sp. Cj3]